MIYDKITTQIREPYYQQNFSNDGQRFIAWYLRNIHLRDMNETRSDITDGSGDKQIDAIYVNDDKSIVYVMQGKFISGAKVDAEPVREVLASWLQLKDLSHLQVVGNNKLQQKLSEVAKAIEDDYEICFELVTTAELTDSAQCDLDQFQKTINEISEETDWEATITLVDKEELSRRYDLAIEIDNPSINHTVDLNQSKYLTETIASTQIVLAAIPLKECIKLPGIKDGTLFQKNVRQSLGTSNRVNKGIRQTILGDKHKDFFFFHNGITAICNKMQITDHKLTLNGLSVVNGCQSLNAILNCSETVKKLEETYVMFRFYEIPQRDRADRISINTNSQSAVKPRDLRSNDKRVLNLKRAFEQKYSNGYFVSKRGEVAPPEKDKRFVIDLSDLGKYLIAWHSQRPNISYGETKIFDKYFDTLFKKEYSPIDVQALNEWMQEVMKNWSGQNPLGLNQTLLAMKAYAPYHHLYAISICFAISNNMSDRVPLPSMCLEQAKKSGLMDEIVKISGISLNMALEAAANEPQSSKKVFSPQNWVKSKACLTGINFAVRNYFQMLPLMPGGGDVYSKLNKGLALDPKAFEYRWAAD